MDILGSLIGAGTSLLSGFMNRDAQKEANQIARENAERNIALQREFAQNAIQWKAADAAKAGIHPLYALGASTTSFSPVSVGQVPETGLAEGIRGMGQDLSRAAGALRSPQERMDAVTRVGQVQQLQGNSLDLESRKLRNELLKLQILKMSSPGTPPGYPSGPFAVPVEDDPKKIDNNQPGMLFGWNLRSNPDTSTASWFENQYGDDNPLTSVFGTAKFFRDVAYTAGWSPDAWRSGGFNTGMAPYGYWQGIRDAVERYRQQPLPVRPSYRGTPYR